MDLPRTPVLVTCAVAPLGAVVAGATALLLGACFDTCQGRAWALPLGSLAVVLLLAGPSLAVLLERSVRPAATALGLAVASASAWLALAVAWSGISR